MDFVFSNHALNQIESRNIDKKTIEKILENPDKITQQIDKLIFQSVIWDNDKNYLIRIFVNNRVNPAVIITAYKTSKIDKYA